MEMLHETAQLNCPIYLQLFTCARQLTFVKLPVQICNPDLFVFIVL